MDDGKNKKELNAKLYNLGDGLPVTDFMESSEETIMYIGMDM